MSTTSNEPSIWTVSPSYCAAFDKFTSLSAAEESILAEMHGINRILDRQTVLMRVDPRQAKTVQKPNVAKRLTDGVRQLLEEFAPPDQPIEPPALTVTYDDPRVARLHELAEEFHNTRAAIEALRPIVEREHAAASRALCAAIQPAYDAAAARVAAALIELGNAKIAHDDLLRRHGEANSGFLRPLSTEFNRLGEPREQSSGFRQAVTWAAECGHFKLSDLPASWREPVPPVGIARPVADAPPAPGGRARK